jgi:hypothetical protein
MTLSKNGFVSRLYAVCYRLGFQFTHGYYQPWRLIFPPETVDLCSLVRTIVVAAPFAIAMNLAVPAAVVVALFAFTSALLPYLTVLASILAVVGALAVVVIGFVVVTQFGGRLAARAARSEVVRVAGEYYRAKKASICPIIEIKSGENTDAAA